MKNPIDDQLLARAVELWSLDPDHLNFVAQRENTIFKVMKGGRSYALRFRRPGLRRDSELEGENQWVTFLAEQGVPVPLPQPSDDGRWIERIKNYQVDCQAWLEGVPLGQTGVPLQIENRQDVFRLIGVLMARLHEASDMFSTDREIVRPYWDLNGLVGEMPLWGPFWDNPGLDSQGKELLLRARDVAREKLRELDGQADFGLIHADLVRENILLSETASGEQMPAAIDFDDGGYGYRLFDVATALFKNRMEPDYEVLQDAMLGGYQSIRPLAVDHLPLFLVLRSFTYPGWNISRIEEPGGRERNKRFVADALAHAELLIR